MVVCASCGHENREEARFCDSCGAALAVTEAGELRKVVTVLFCDTSRDRPPSASSSYRQRRMEHHD